jgi:branched-chain amino acid transport system substrate-binding protein
MRILRPVALAALTFAASPGRTLAADPIKIGAVLAVSGPAVNLGTPEARTLLMLTDDLNSRGGINGRKVQLILKNTAASPEKAVSSTKQLIQEQNVFAIIGPSTSGETMAVKSIAEESKTILISCAAAEAIVNPVAKYVFKTPQKDSHAVVKILQYMKRKGISKIGVLASNTAFGQAGKEQIAKLAPEYGVQVLLDQTYDKDATDLSRQVTKLKAAKVQAVINWSIEPAQATVIKDIRRIGLTIPVFQSHGFGNIQYVKWAGSAAEGVIFPGGRLLVADGLSNKNPQKAILLSYKKEYEAKYQEDVSGFGGYAYDAFMILTRAIREVGVDKEKVRTAIENTKGSVGTSGIFNFSPTDHNGLDIESFEMLTVKNGKFVPLER